jgi:Arc/MetJ-type ribon-helix-helix transcriptional regulator
MEGNWNMANETEKLTINLGVVELAQIDVLVEQGIYSNRSDFIRTAVRNHLKDYSSKIEHQLTPIGSKEEWTGGIGIVSISKSTLEELVVKAQKQKEVFGNGIAISKLNISAIGMLIINKDISAELFEKTVAKVSIRGKLVASEEIKKIIKEMK